MRAFFRNLIISVSEKLDGAGGVDSRERESGFGKGKIEFPTRIAK